jgi:hypothetical protein
VEETKEMNYKSLLTQAWNIVWQHKFLIVLGILVALSNSGQAGAASSSQSLPQSDATWQLPLPPNWSVQGGAPLQALRSSNLSLVMSLILLVVALIVILMVWLISTLARGALIAGASAVDDNRETSFGAAFATAWRRGWILLGIGVFPAIPGLLLLLGAWGAATLYTGLPPVINGVDLAAGPRNLSLVLAGLTCLALPLALVLNLLRTFADRACILDDCGVFASYGRGFQVLSRQIGPALVLFLIQLGIGIALVLGLLLPALCCVFWPLLLLVQGTAAAFFSTMWTLAWRQWAAAEQ